MADPPIPLSARNLIRSLASPAQSIIARATAFGASFLIAVLTARALGAQGRGVMAVATTFTMTVVSFATFGAQQGMLRVLATAPDVKGVLRAAQKMAALLGIIATLAVLAFVGTDVLTLGAPTWALVVSAAAIAPAMVSLVTTDGLVGAGRVRERDRSVFAAAAAPALVVLGLFSAGRLTLAAVLAIWVSGELIRALLANMYVRRLPERTPLEGVTSWSLAGQILRHGVLLQPSTLSITLILRIDLLLVAVLLDARFAGIYSVSLAASELHTALCAAVTDRYTSPLLVNRADRRHLIRVLSRSALIATALGVLLIAALPTIIGIFGEAFTDAQGPATWLLVGTWSLAAMRPALVHNVARARPAVMATLGMTAATTNVLCNLVFIPRWGLVGAAAASMLSYLALSLSHTMLALRR